MELVLVQLTDVHIKDDNDLDIISERISSLGGAICNHVTEPDETAVLFCITGDLAFSGQENQYIMFELVLDELYSMIKRRFPKVCVYSVFVPGNHDCDFSDEAESIRNVLLAAPTLDIADPAQLKACTAIQRNYFKFVEVWDNKQGALSCDPDKILTINELKFANETINIKLHCLNTSWCSKRHEEKGKMKIVNGTMCIPSNQLPEKATDDIVITLMHHDVEWMDWDDKTIWNEYNKKYSDIVMVGHDHATEFVLKQNYDESSNYFIKGNQLYDASSPEQSGFNILKINTAHAPMQECFFTYKWDGTLYKKVIDTGYRPFKKNRFYNSSIELKEEVQEFLEEMDIDIECGSKKEIKLSDIFGFPTLREDKKDNIKFIRDMQSLLLFIEDNRYVSIRGQKEYGKTSLLKQIFKQYFEMKKFPVYLDIAKINTADGEALNRIIEDKYEKTYNNVDASVIMQKDSSERVCFIDDFENIKLQDKSAKKLLQYFINKFDYVIITRNHTLDILNPLNYVEMNDYIDEVFSVLLLQSTKRTSKERIISKWLQLIGEDEKDSLTFDAKRKEKYAQVQTIMKSTYFNKTPIDLLLVLSYLEQDRPAQLDYSRYSYVYDELILKKLRLLAEDYGHDVSNNISIFKTILQKIAYKMYTDNIKEYVKEDYVLSVILDYKESHSNAKLKATDVIQRFVNFKLLECKEDCYKFRHNYMYYYFVGSYIDGELSALEKNQIIENVFENITEDVNYNIALFLAYKLNITHDIIPLVTKLGNSLLSQYEDFNYDNIKKLIEEWGGNIEKRVERIYNVPQNEEIPVIRNKKMEVLEEEESKNEVEDSNSEVDEEVRQTNSDVIKISRYVDFMGNILKNYSGKLENTARESGIDFIFRSSSKIVGSLCNFSMYAVDKIIHLVEEKIKEGTEEDIKIKSDFTEAIKASFASILFTFIEANLSAIACNLDSDILKENIAAYCEMHNSEFVRMARLEYLIRISSIKLPIDEINALFKSKNCLSEISQKILKDNIYRYLVSYQYDWRDKQTACTILDFKIHELIVQESKLSKLSEKY